MSHGSIGDGHFEWTGRWEDVEVTLSLVVVDGRSEVRRIVLEAPSELTRRRLRDVPLGYLRQDALGHLRRFWGLLADTRVGTEVRRVMDGAEAPLPRTGLYPDGHYLAVLEAYNELGTYDAVAGQCFVSRSTARRWVERGRALADRG